VCYSTAVKGMSEGISNESSSQKELEEPESAAENGAKTERMLTVFDSPSEFFKRLVPMELWGFTLNEDPVSRMMESMKGTIKNWQPSDKMQYKMPDLKDKDTKMLRLIWNSRDSIESIPINLREVAKLTRKTTFAHFKKMLNKGRSMFLECRLLNPTLLESALKYEMIRAFKATESGPGLEEARKKHNKKKWNSLTTALSAKKKAKKTATTTTTSSRATTLLAGGTKKKVLDRANQSLSRDSIVRVDASSLVNATINNSVSVASKGRARAPAKDSTNTGQISNEESEESSLDDDDMLLDNLTAPVAKQPGRALGIKNNLLNTKTNSIANSSSWADDDNSGSEEEIEKENKLLVVRSPKKKRSRKIKEIKHADLFATLKQDTADRFPPIKSNDSTNGFDPPGIAWKSGAVRLLHVLVRLLSQIKESSALGGRLDVHSTGPNKSNP